MTRKAALWTAAGVLLVSNLAVLTGAGLNRRAEPEAVLELTERELRLPPSTTAENTALALTLRWSGGGAMRRAGEPEQLSRWFDRAKLEAIGFDCSAPLAENTVFRYRNTPFRRTYAVLEFEGEAWRGFLAAGAAAQQQTRLLVVDAGNDPAALRQKWTDRKRTIVLPAVAGVAVEKTPEGLRLRGRIVQIFPMQLNVPRSLRGPFEALSREGEGQAGGPRYRVTVKWGQGAPWISDVKPTPPPR